MYDCKANSENFPRLKTAHYCKLSLQCDQIGRFLEVLGNKISSEKTKWMATFWGFWKASLLWKTALATFWATFGKNWATFYFNIWSHSFSNIPYKKFSILIQITFDLVENANSSIHKTYSTQCLETPVHSVAENNKKLIMCSQSKFFPSYVKYQGIVYFNACYTGKVNIE